MIIGEIRRLRAEGWPPVAKITDPERVRTGLHRVELIDADGEKVGDAIEFPAEKESAALALVEAARRQLRR
jgi:hypothetical protein